MRWPSISDFNPARSTAGMCTNTSRPPSSGLMNPYPRSPLKNLTVPVIAIEQLLPRGCFAAGPHGATAWPDIHTGKASAQDGLSHSAGPPQEAERLSQPCKIRPILTCGKVGNYPQIAVCSVLSLSTGRRSRHQIGIGGGTRQQLFERRHDNAQLPIEREGRIDQNQSGAE